MDGARFWGGTGRTRIPLGRPEEVPRREPRSRDRGRLSRGRPLRSAGGRRGRAGDESPARPESMRLAADLRHVAQAVREGGDPAPRARREACTYPDSQPASDLIRGSYLASRGIGAKPKRIDSRDPNARLTRIRNATPAPDRTSPVA